MKYKIPEVGIMPVTDIKDAAVRADLYCIRAGENCEDIPCQECVFNSPEWNKEKEKQLLDWEKSQNE